MPCKFIERWHWVLMDQRFTVSMCPLCMLEPVTGVADEPHPHIPIACVGLAIVPGGCYDTPAGRLRLVGTSLAVHCRTMTASTVSGTAHSRCSNQELA